MDCSISAIKWKPVTVRRPSDQHWDLNTHRGCRHTSHAHAPTSYRKRQQRWKWGWRRQNSAAGHFISQWLKWKQKRQVKQIRVIESHSISQLWTFHINQSHLKENWKIRAETYKCASEASFHLLHPKHQTHRDSVDLCYSLMRSFICVSVHQGMACAAN